MSFQKAWDAICTWLGSPPAAILVEPYDPAAHKDTLVNMPGEPNPSPYVPLPSTPAAVVRVRVPVKKLSGRKKTSTKKNRR